MNFPILAREVHGKRLVYLDNAATSQKPQEVIDAMSKYYAEHNANVARGLHTLGEESTELYHGAREKVASFLNINSRQVVFTAGATDSLNFVAQWALSILKPGDEIVLSVLEHHANLVPWQAIADKAQAKLVFVNITDCFEFDMDDYESKLSEKTRIVAVSHVSNVLGTIMPIKDIAVAAHERGAFVVVDGAQAVGHLPVDVSDLGVDFYAFSAHKMYGPQGIGVLAVEEELLEQLSPFRFGGGMIAEVSTKGFSLADVPERFEAGTPNVAGAVGLAAAIDFINETGLDKIQEVEHELATYAREQLKDLVKLYAPAIGSGILAFDVPSINSLDVAQVVSDNGIAIRNGMHCAMPLHQALNVEALNRASFAVYNTKEDVDTLVAAIKEAISLFGGRK